MNISSVIANDNPFDELVYEVFTSVRDNSSVQHYYSEHAKRSKKWGYNAWGWAKVAEACAKTYFIDHPVPELLTDKFILSLAIELAHYHSLTKEEKLEVARTVQ